MNLDATVMSSRCARATITRDGVRTTARHRAVFHPARLRRKRLRGPHRPRLRASHIRDSRLSTRAHARDATADVPRDDANTANKK